MAHHDRIEGKLNMEFKLNIKGKAPLIMQSITLANPLHPLAKEIKAITGKRKKTDEDLVEILRLKFFGSIYHDDQLGPFIPGENIDRCFFDAAKELKLGNRWTQSALFVEDKLPLIYEGPRSIDKLYADLRFVDVRMVTVNRARVPMCRPIFNVWSIKPTLAFDEQRINPDDIKQIIGLAGFQKLGTFRRRFGRFDAEIVK
jgi:hypothetical protein